jgi:hypothetical protein
LEAERRVAWEPKVAIRCGAGHHGQIGAWEIVVRWRIGHRDPVGESDAAIRW